MMSERFRYPVLIRLIVLALLGTAHTDVAVAQGYHSSAQAPPSWVQFAKLVKYRFEAWIGGDHPQAARFRVYVSAHTGREDDPPPVLDVKAWVNAHGLIARVSFPPFKDKGATEDLKAILTRGNVGERPPPDMLQPLNLRFAISPLKKSGAAPARADPYAPGTGHQRSEPSSRIRST